jgi:hypothetical protein
VGSNPTLSALVSHGVGIEAAPVADDAQHADWHRGRGDGHWRSTRGADIVPHLAYGLATTIAYEAFSADADRSYFFMIGGSPAPVC